MEIHRGDTLSGYVVTATEDEYVLTLYSTDATFADSTGEIIVDALMKYDVETVSDAEVHQLFAYAKNYFDNLKAYIKEVDE
jgi:aspartate 1-decarboxylase